MAFDSAFNREAHVVICKMRLFSFLLSMKLHWLVACI
jgi:hypothetical protein